MAYKRKLQDKAQSEVLLEKINEKRIRKAMETQERENNQKRMEHLDAVYAEQDLI